MKSILLERSKHIIGPQGPRGANGISFSNKGDWDIGISYHSNDVVKYFNSIYAAKAPSTGVIPTNTLYWYTMIEAPVLYKDVYSEITTYEIYSIVKYKDIYYIANKNGPIGLPDSSLDWNEYSFTPEYIRDNFAQSILPQLPTEDKYLRYNLSNTELEWIDPYVGGTWNFTSDAHAQMQLHSGVSSYECSLTFIEDNTLGLWKIGVDNLPNSGFDFIIKNTNNATPQLRMTGATTYFNTHIYPQLDNTFDLGNSTNGFRHLYAIDMLGPAQDDYLNNVLLTYETSGGILYINQSVDYNGNPADDIVLKSGPSKAPLNDGDAYIVRNGGDGANIVLEATTGTPKYYGAGIDSSNAVDGDGGDIILQPGLAGGSSGENGKIINRGETHFIDTRYTDVYSFIRQAGQYTDCYAVGKPGIGGYWIFYTNDLNGDSQISMRLEADGGVTLDGVPNIFTSNAANLYISPTTGRLYRNTCGEIHKTNIRPLEVDTSKVLEIDVMTYEATSEDDMQTFHTVVGNQNMLDNYPPAANINDKGEVDSIHWNSITSALLVEVRKLREELNALKNL